MGGIAEQAVERAVRAGIVVVISAGNHGQNAAGQIGYAGLTSPGNAPSALTVGSLRTKATLTRLDDEISPFSSRGPTWYDGRVKPDVVAPGQGLVAINTSSSTLYQNEPLRADIAPYLKLSGTSMAAAVAEQIRVSVHIPEEPVAFEFEQQVLTLDPATWRWAVRKARRTGLPHNQARLVFQREIVSTLTYRLVDQMEAVVFSETGEALDGGVASLVAGSRVRQGATEIVHAGARRARQRDRLERLGQRPDLVDLHEN